jgi:hypothetical protein
MLKSLRFCRLAPSPAVSAAALASPDGGLGFAASGPRVRGRRRLNGGVSVRTCAAVRDHSCPQSSSHRTAA